MRRFGYYLGIALLIAGAAVGMAQLLTIVQGEPSTLSLGAIWYRVHSNSLVGFQGLVETSLSPDLWPPILWVLSIPGWLLLIPPGLLLVVLCRPR